MKFYTGTGLLQPVKLSDATGDILAPYLPDNDLVQAVNLAVMLGRPLLVMGEPGCGKSQLATAVAFELYHDNSIDGKAQDFRDWFFKWNIKSTSKAKDGFYDYNALGRLLDVQLAAKLAEGDALKAQNAEAYITKRAMSEAIAKSAVEYPAVLLIDEIDKADLDFPNDLLNELEGGNFIVPETGKPIVEKKANPLIIITSNRERDLPEAFLRRCIYYFIPPFDKQRLIDILTYRFYSKNPTAPDATSSSLIKNAVDAFDKARQRIKENKTSVKNISTSELIDWFGALKQTATNSDGSVLLSQIQSFLDDKTKNLPLQQALFKNFETVEIFKK